jgi:hypothetical protein
MCILALAHIAVDYLGRHISTTSALAGKIVKLDTSHGDVAVVRFDNPDGKVSTSDFSPTTL